MNINNATALGTGTLSFGGSATIDNTSAAAITLANNNPLTLGGGSLTFTGTKDLNLGTGAVTLNAGRSFTTTAGTLTLGGTISGATFGVTKLGGGTLVLNGPLATTSGTLKMSAGTLTLAGANTYSGATTLSAGTINVNSTTAFGTSSSVAMNGITLDNTTAAAISNANNNAISLGGNNIFTGTKDLNLGSGAVTMTASRTWTVNAGTLLLPIPVSVSRSSLPYCDTCFMVNEDAALLNRPVTQVTPAALFDRRLQ